MAFDCGQFADLVGRVLREHGLYSRAAVVLLLGTAAQESRFGTYLRQKGGGPALGVFQMEQTTFEWLRARYGGQFSELRERSFDELEWDLRLAILLARLRYHAVPASLPDHDDIPGLAAYWKEHYNTAEGKGTGVQFHASFERYVGQWIRRTEKRLRTGS